MSIMLASGCVCYMDILYVGLSDNVPCLPFNNADVDSSFEILPY